MQNAGTDVAPAMPVHMYNGFVFELKTQIPAKGRGKNRQW